MKKRKLSVLMLIVFSVLACSEERASTEKNTGEKIVTEQPVATETDWENAKISSQQALQDIWNAGKKSSKEIWQESKTSSLELWDSGKEKSSELWQEGKENSKDTWGDSKEKSSELWQEGNDKFNELFNAPEDHEANENFDEI